MTHLHWTTERHTGAIVATVVHTPRPGDTFVYSTTYSVEYSGKYWYLVITDAIQNADGSAYDVSKTLEFVSTLPENLELAKTYADGVPLIPFSELVEDLPPF